MHLNTPPTQFGNLRFYAWVLAILLTAWIVMYLVAPHPGRDQPKHRATPAHQSDAHMQAPHQKNALATE